MGKGGVVMNECLQWRPHERGRYIGFYKSLVTTDGKLTYYGRLHVLDRHVTVKSLQLDWDLCHSWQSDLCHGEERGLHQQM